MKVLFLVRNPLDYYASLTRRLPRQPYHNMLRWVADHQAAAQVWRDPRAHVTRYEDASSPSDRVRGATFGAIFRFLGLELSSALRARYAIATTNTTLEASSCYSEFVENHTATLHKALRHCERSQPLMVNQNLWRRDADATRLAHNVARKAEATSGGALGRLAAALAYVEEDELLRHALASDRDA
jgi:hypothetical protein